jgi:hypothetical protein
MKDASLFSKKKGRNSDKDNDELKGSENAASPKKNKLVDPAKIVLDLKEDYITQISAATDFLQNFYNSLMEDIILFTDKWDVLAGKITLAQNREQEVENELEAEEIFSLKTPINHLYIEQLELLREYGKTIDDVYFFVESINKWICFIQERIARIRSYCEGVDSGEHTRDMIATAMEMEVMRDKVGNQRQFVRGEMSGLIDKYKGKDTSVKKDIDARLAERPELAAWVNPFVNQDADTDPLLNAIATLKIANQPRVTGD